MDIPFMILPDGKALHLIHFLAGERVVCQSGLVPKQLRARPGQAWQRTNETRAVTCPLCKATEAFQEANTELELVLAQGRFLS